MIESLLHANVVLSKEQAETVRQNCERHHYTTKVPSDRKIAIITYLGKHSDKIGFLVRFARPYIGKNLTFVIREALGFDHEDLYLDSFSVYRLIVWRLVDEEPKNPAGLLRSMARKLAMEFTRNVSPFVD